MRIRAWFLVVVILLTAGCGLIPSLPQPTPKPKGLAAPLAFHQVTETRPAPCPSGQDPAFLDPNDPQSCLVLGPSRLTVAQLERVSVESDQTGQWVVQIKLPADATDGLAALTTELAGEQEPANRMAMIIDQELIMAATVQGPIPNGELQLAGNFTQDEAGALLKKLGG